MRYVFSHTTALALLGVEQPRMSDGTPFAQLHLSTRHRTERHRLKGASLHLWSHDDGAFLFADTFFCVSPVVAWAQMAQHLSLKETVALGDSMMRRSRHIRDASLQNFEDYLTTEGRFIGKPQCIEALRYMTENTDSSQESRLMFLLQRLGLPRPEANYPVIDPAGGKTLFLDLAYPEHRVCIEYDGAYHFDSNQRQRDYLRQARLETMGWTILRVEVNDLKDRNREAHFIRALFLALS